MPEMNSDDLLLQAEREAVERLFRKPKIVDTEWTQREDDLRKLAAILFMSYFDAEQRDGVLFGPNASSPMLPDVVEEYLSKADKIYEFFQDFEGSLKCIQFLRTADLNLSKELVERL